MSGLYSVQGRWSVVRFVSMLAACGAISISGSARADCVFDKEGNLIWKNFLGGQTATVKCEPKPFKAATAEKPRDSFLISSLVEPLDTTDPLPIAASSLRIVVTDASGDEIEPAKAIKGLYAVRTYAVTSATEASARIEAAKKSVEPTAAHLESLRQCWGDWASGLTGTCNAAGLRSLHAKLLMEQRKHCTRPIGIEPKARCAWYVRALELTSEALKPGGSNQSLAPDAQCAALDALFQSSGKTTCALATDVTAIREMDKLMENPAAVPSGSYDVLVSKTEFVSGRDSEFFRTVDYEQSATLVNPSEGANSYVAITNFPHDLDATIEWKAEREDPSAPLRNAAGFVGFLIASYARQPVSLPTVSVGSSSGQVTLVPPKEVVLDPPAAHKNLSDAQALLDLLPPVNEKGTRFIGPIRPQKDTRYRLSVVERVAEGKPRTTMMASQSIDYLPRYAWFVTVNAGVSVDVFMNEGSGASVQNPMYEHEWIANEAGSTSTSFLRESSYLWARRLTPFIGLMVSPPWAGTNWDWGRFVFQLSVGVPLNQPRGIAQYGLGVGLWGRCGVSLVLSGILRTYDQPISAVGTAQLVLPNNGTTAPATPVIGVREAVAGGLSLSLAFDLGKAGEAFLGAVKPLFTKEDK